MLEARVRLANELDGEAGEAVAEDEGADELARLVARVGLPEEEPEDQNRTGPSRIAS